MLATFGKSWGYLLSVAVIYGLCFVFATCLVTCNIYFKYYRLSGVKPSMAQRRSGSAGIAHSSAVSLLFFELQERVHEYVLRYCSRLSLLSFHLMTAFAFFYRLQDLRAFGSQNWCETYTELITALWVFGKYNMYMVFIARVHVAFSGSAFGYSKRWIYTLYALVTAAALPTFPTIPFLVSGRTKHVSGNPPNDKMVVCTSHLNFYLVLYGFILDATMSPLLVALFTRPLVKLFRVRKNTGSMTIPIRQLEMQLLPLKFTVTTTMAVLCTTTSLVIMAATDMGFLIITDGVVNMFCLIIMTSRWTRVYWWLCAPLLRAVAFLCFDDVQRNDLERIVVYHSKATATTR